MSMYVDVVSTELQKIIEDYSVLNDVLCLDSDNNVKFEFNSDNDLVNTLILCRNVMVPALRLHTYLIDGEISEIECEHTKELYKRSQIKVAYAILYHDLKNVFEIVDIAASSKHSTITLHNITQEDMENVYVAMTSFVLQTMKVYGSKFGVGGAKRRGRPRKGTTAVEAV